MSCSQPEQGLAVAHQHLLQDEGANRWPAEHPTEIYGKPAASVDYARGDQTASVDYTRGDHTGRSVVSLRSTPFT